MWPLEGWDECHKIGIWNMKIRSEDGGHMISLPHY